MSAFKLPNDDSRVRFKDVSGIEREGIYKKESNGYVEISYVTMPEETKYLYPENEIVSWKYIREEDIDMTKFLL